MLRGMQYSSERLAPCLLRVALGVFCIRLGLWGYVEEAQFRTAIEVYAGFNGVGLTLYSIIGPLLLFAAGGLLILGLFTKVAALLAIAIFLPLVVAAGAVGVLENPLVLIPEKRTIYKDLVLLAGFASLALSGPGAVAVDNALRSLYGRSQQK
jgi:uncharacterized membrane protein YphA (DoxX/SURF4 family)